MQQEIQTEEEECKERIKNLDQSVKEVWPRMYILGTRIFFLCFYRVSLPILAEQFGRIPGKGIFVFQKNQKIIVKTNKQPNQK